MSDPKSDCQGAQRANESGAVVPGCTSHNPRQIIILKSVIVTILRGRGGDDVILLFLVVSVLDP